MMTALVVAAVMVLVCVLLAATSAGRWSFGVFFNVDTRVVSIAQKTLGYISMNAVIQVLSEIHSGIVIQNRETTAIFVSSVLNLAIQMVISLTLVDIAKGSLHPLVVPILAIYAGNLSRLAVLLFWYYRRVHCKLSLQRDDGSTLRIRETMGIFVPLASLAVARAITIPMARIFMSKSLQGKKIVAEENAIFSLILPVERLFNSWLNRLKDLYLAFSRHKDKLTTERAVVFTLGCLVCCVGGLGVFTATPIFSTAYFHEIFNIGINLAQRCASTLAIFIFLPFPSCLRAHAVYWLVKEKQTGVILPFVFLRLLALPMTDLGLGKFQITGAELGAALCVSCHAVEAILLSSAALYLYYRKLHKLNKTKSEEEMPLQGHM